jgi:LacI family transcriptional regulator
LKIRRRVALLIETSNSYGRGLLRGVHAYLREHDTWSTYLSEQARGDAPPFWLNRSWQGDGIIARIENKRIARTVRQTGLPVINVSSSLLVRNLPSVETNGEAVARLAAEHLAGRGLEHFGFFGDDRFRWSITRGEQFSRIIQAMGYSCSVYGLQKQSGAQPSWDREERQLTAWLRDLPKPAGVMASYDLRGLQLLQVCRRMGLAVPDEIAVLGVDNDEILCNLSTPPLSSVAQDTYRLGYDAAKLLDQWMAGKRPAEGLQIDPLGIVTRQSSDSFAVTDPQVSRAMQFIREHACDGINVDQILEVVPLSRRMLEHRFKKLLGRTPHDEILNLQFERAKQLLTETSLPLAAVAERVGFRHAEYLSVAFKRRFGTPPGEYRNEHRR